MNKTYVSQTYPWGLFKRHGHRLLCSDGTIRAARLAPTPDTFFSIPASINIRRKTVSGYATTEEHNGERIFCFRHLTKYNDRLPAWPERCSKEFDKLADSALA